MFSPLGRHQEMRADPGPWSAGTGCRGRACSGLQPPPSHCPRLPCCWMHSPASTQAPRCRARVPRWELPAAAVAVLTPALGLVLWARLHSPRLALAPSATILAGCALLRGSPGGEAVASRPVSRGSTHQAERAGPVAWLSLVLCHHREAL